MDAYFPSCLTWVGFAAKRDARVQCELCLTFSLPGKREGAEESGERATRLRKKDVGRLHGWGQ
jgi:hypothetical protein